MLESLDIYRAARLLIDNHGLRAKAYAAAWVKALRETGNATDARMLDQIAAAIDHLLRVSPVGRKPARGRARRRGRAKVVRMTRSRA